jgi:hypothetical protein
MDSINLIIIPEWEEIDEKRNEFYDGLYERLTTEGVNVGFAPDIEVFLSLLDLVAKQEDRYLFIVGENTSETDEIFIQERLVIIGYGPEWIRNMKKLQLNDHRLLEQLEGWLKEIESPHNKERLNN